MKCKKTFDFVTCDVCGNKMQDIGEEYYEIVISESVYQVCGEHVECMGNLIENHINKYDNSLNVGVVKKKVTIDVI